MWFIYPHSLLTVQLVPLEFNKKGIALCIFNNFNEIAWEYPNFFATLWFLMYITNTFKESCPCALTQHHAMKAYLGSGGIASRILDLGTRWRWMVSFTPLLLYLQGNGPWHPLDRRLGGLQSRYGPGGEEKNSQPLPGLELPIIRPVAQCYTTELSRLLLEKV
jgi:hypothetical protein